MDVIDTEDAPECMSVFDFEQMVHALAEQLESEHPALGDDITARELAIIESMKVATHGDTRTVLPRVISEDFLNRVNSLSKFVQERVVQKVYEMSQVESYN